MKPDFHVLTAMSLVALLGLVVAPAAAQNAQLPLPPTDSPPEGIPDLGGVWNGPSILREPALREALGGGLPPFTPFGQEQWDSRELALDPTGLCQPSGPGRVLHSPMYYQILQTEGQVTFLFEIYHQFHRVFTDGRDHPQPLDHTWWGSSIGRYEGNKLIVETQGLNDASWLFTAGAKHSDQLRLVWELEKTGPDSIRVTETFEDPVYYTEPWSISYDLERTEYDMMEMVCTDNNRDVEFMTLGTQARPY